MQLQPGCNQMLTEAYLLRFLNSSASLRICRTFALRRLNPLASINDQLLAIQNEFIAESLIGSKIFYLLIPQVDVVSVPHDSQ